MASGTGERPLGTPEQEKALLELSNLKSKFAWGEGSNWTRKLTFSGNVVKAGLIFIWGTGGSSIDKDGIYYYASTTSSNFHLRTIKATTQSGTSVSATSAGVVTIVNGQYGMGISVLAVTGDLPSIELQT